MTVASVFFIAQCIHLRNKIELRMKTSTFVGKLHSFISLKVLYYVN